MIKKMNANSQPFRVCGAGFSQPGWAFRADWSFFCKNLCLLCAIALFAGCIKRSDNPAELAVKYCACMENNGASNDYYNARVICDSKFIQENRLFRMYYIEATYGRYFGALDKSTRDSVIAFNHDFFIEASKKCSYVFKADSIADAYLGKHKQ